MSSSRPRSITGSAGSRIKVILGEKGSDYLYYLNEDNGQQVWQSKSWTNAQGGPPVGLCKQINNMSAKGRYITYVAFDTSGQWFISGIKRDGTGGHSWWGGTDASDQIRKATAESSYKIAFSPEGTSCNEYPFMSNPAWVVVQGNNAYSTSGVDSDLLSRMKQINGKGGTIKCVQLFAIHGYAPGYLIADSEGTEWKSVGEHLSMELKTGGIDPVLDVAVARDGSWIVIRPNRYSASKGVSSTLTATLSKFYREHRERQSRQGEEIKAYDARILREQREREAEMRRQEEARLEAERVAKERRRKEMERKEAEASLKRRCDEADRLRQIRTKRLKPMERVTAVGFSSEPGDSLVKRIGGHGTIEVFKPLHQDQGTIVIRDPRLLTPYHSEEDSETLTLLCFAADKYEAAVSVYNCACHNGVCLCTRTFSGSFLPQSILNSTDERLISNPPPRPVIEVADSNATTSIRFDEYKCPEKIDLSRLKAIVKDLSNDSDLRAEWLEKLTREKHQLGDIQYDDLKKLQRCNALETIAKTLATRLESLPIDDDGCVVYQVEYEHRDPSGRGRLFAVGEKIQIADDKYPRTATLQGMQSDLRTSLVGRFAHDIDCENSEVRLICSIAQQLDLAGLIPTIFSYRDNRDWWLRRISETHGVSDSEAKRLVNIILSGGRYETWLKRVGMSSAPASTPRDIKNLYFKLYAEIGVLRDQLLQHPRFKWTEVEREKLQKEGRPAGSIDSALLPRIVQSCENEVLGIIHRAFCRNNWAVRAKVFDGLIVEPGLGVSLELEALNKKAEESCRNLGWDIRLVEKPLHGIVDDPVTIAKAREVIAQRGRLNRVHVL